MNLHHCTEFAAFENVLRTKCLVVNELPDFPIFGSIGIKGLWLSTESYGEQFYGPYQITFPARLVLPEKFLQLSTSPMRDILLGSYSPHLEALGTITGHALVSLDTPGFPISRAADGQLDRTKKIDVILDSPLPLNAASNVSAGSSLRNRRGVPTTGWDRTWWGSGARLTSLLLTQSESATDEFIRTDATSLAKRLFYELHGFSFTENVARAPQLVPGDDPAREDIIGAAAERLVANAPDDARVFAALAGSKERLADLIVEAMTRRFRVTVTREDVLSE